MTDYKQSPMKSRSAKKFTIKKTTSVTKQRVKTAKGRKISSTHWLQRHINDPYVIEARKLNYVSRAAFKLLEIDAQFGIFEQKHDNGAVLDLGCAPGSWLQVIEQKCHKNTKIIGIDLQDIAVKNTELFHLVTGDFTSQEVQLKLADLLINRRISLLLSDMAPSSCGDKQTDHIRIINLLSEVWLFALNNLAEGANMVCKLIRGGREVELLKEMRIHFKQLKTFKPSASYDDSGEMFLVALGFKQDIHGK